MINNCSCYTKNNRKCKNKIYHIINAKNFCYIHAQKEFYNYCLIIQTSWITYKKNKKFQLYLKLPDDIKNQIKLTIHRDYYLKKLLKKFLNNKINFIVNFDINININNLMKNINELYNNYSYIFKYKFLIENNDISDIIKIANNTNQICLDIIINIEQTYILYNQIVDQDMIDMSNFYANFTHELFEFNIWLSNKLL
jgi:hypothetical protein